jgi:site-specific DNA recombinase
VTAPRAAIYCRVSDKGARDAYGMDSQERECRAYAAERGWQVVTVYREWHTGAELFERPEMTRLREAMRQRAFDVLLVHRVDRLARNLNHQGYILAEVEQAGVLWESATEDLSDPLTGGILRAVIGAFAEMDRGKIAANSARGKREKVAGGRPLGQGKPSYGLTWRRDDAGKHIGWTEDPATIGHLRRIFADYDQGSSLRALGRALEADGVLPPYHERTGSTTWQASSLRSILTDRVYIGQGEAFRTESRKVLDRATGRRVTQRRSRSADERVRLPAGAAPVIIDPAQFARVQTRLQGNQSRATDFRTTRNPEVGILRRGLAYCGQCGNRLVVVTSRGVPSYRCEGRERTGCPSAVTIPVAQVDDAVWDWLAAVLSDEDRVRWHLDSLRREDPTSFDLASIDRQRHELERQQAKFVAVIERMEDPEAAGPIAAKLDALGPAARGECARPGIPPGATSGVATRPVADRRCARLLPTRLRRHGAGDGVG